MRKKIVLLLLGLVLLGVSKYVYDVHLNYNFKEISEKKVYKSGVIPPNKIAGYIKDHNINSVIDLRFPHTKDKINNPEIPEELTAEKEAVEKLEGVTYFNLGTDQVPTQDTVDEFLQIMDNPDNYPATTAWDGHKCFLQFIELSMRVGVTKMLENKHVYY